LAVSLREQLRALGRRDALPPALLDVRVQEIGGLFVARPRDWEQLRHEEGGAGRAVPYWAQPWPSGIALAELVAPPAGASVLEIGCGLGLPSLAAARAGARVLATDGSLEAVAYTAHSFALNELDGEAAVVDWGTQSDALAARGPWDLVLAADVLYLQANVELALRLLPRLVAPGGEILLADPDRAGARDFLAAARSLFELRTTRHGEVSVHRLSALVAS
jgi:predicted nicotinamide N-methyase